MDDSASREGRRAAERRYREANREVLRERARQYREANREATLESMRRYREANPEAILEGKRRYREANREAMRESDRRRYAANREAELDRGRQYREANREIMRERGRRYYAENREILLARDRRRIAHIQALVFNHYGWQCACPGCGNTDLSIDHVNGGGKVHREALFGRSAESVQFYLLLIAENFPAGYQTLCRPCNSSKGSSTHCRLVHPTLETP